MEQRPEMIAPRKPNRSWARVVCDCRLCAARGAPRDHQFPGSLRAPSGPRIELHDPVLRQV
eukprot:10662820-Alexandrium_andersonii.AAC.1